MGLILFVIYLFYVAILLGVLYCTIRGVAMCFAADTTLGVIAMILCATVVFASVCFFLYCVELFWKRNLANELMDYINRPQPKGDDEL